MAMENFTIGLLMDVLITLIRVRTQANTADAQHKIDYQLLSIFLFFKNASTLMSSDWLSKYADELWLADGLEYI